MLEIVHGEVDSRKWFALAHHAAIWRSNSSKLSTFRLFSDLPVSSSILFMPSFVTTVLAELSIGCADIHSAWNRSLSKRTVTSQSLLMFKREKKFALLSLHPVYLWRVCSSANDKLLPLLMLRCLDSAPKSISLFNGRQANQYCP